MVKFGPKMTYLPSKNDVFTLNLCLIECPHRIENEISFSSIKISVNFDVLGQWAFERCNKGENSKKKFVKKSTDVKSEKFWSTSVTSYQENKNSSKSLRQEVREIIICYLTAILSQKSSETG